MQLVDKSQQILVVMLDLAQKYAVPFWVGERCAKSDGVVDYPVLNPLLDAVPHSV